MKNSITVSICATVFIFLLSCSVHAAYYNNYQYIIGERAFGMGGAYTALADDSTALWYNPAGLSRISSRNVNITANTYSYLHTKTSGYREFQKKDGSYEKINVDEKDFSAVANTLCFGWNIGNKQSIALGIFIPIQETTKGTAKSVFDFSDNVQMRFRGEYDLKSKYYIGMMGWGMEPLKGLSIGVSVGFGYYHSAATLDRYIYIFASSPVVYEYLLASKIITETTQYTARTNLGIQYRITARNIIGLVAQSPAWRIGGQSDIEKISANAQSSGYEYNEVSESIVTDDELFRPVFPSTLSAGYAYSNPRAFSVSVEASPVFKTAGRSNNVVNAKVGAEIYLTGLLVLRAGLFTDFSQKEDITEDTVSDYDPIIEKLDYYGATLSISLATEFGDRENQQEPMKSWTTIGVLVRYGTGHVLASRFELDTPPISYKDPVNVKKSKSIINIGISIAESVVF